MAASFEFRWGSRTHLPLDQFEAAVSTAFRQLVNDYEGRIVFSDTHPRTISVATAFSATTTFSALVAASGAPDIGATGSRFGKGWFTDLDVTNAITGSVSGSSGSTTGNAATATKLATARTINTVSFDGTANITVTAAAGTLSGNTLAAGVTASSLTSVGTLAADLLLGSGIVLKVNGTQVVGAQGAAVADASGGVVIDAEARTALNALLARVRTHGLIAT